jgi:hypothetical protein
MDYASRIARTGLIAGGIFFLFLIAAHLDTIGTGFGWVSAHWNNEYLWWVFGAILLIFIIGNIGEAMWLIGITLLQVISKLAFYIAIIAGLGWIGWRFLHWL